MGPLFQRLWSYIPSGGTLPEEIWVRRCRFLLGLTWFHAGLIALIGPAFGYSWEISLDALFRDGTVIHTVFEGLIVALLAGLASYDKAGRAFQATMLGFGLMTSSAILVHLSGGYIELHFHFFVMLTFLALLQDWVPYLLSILYVAIHHGVVGVLWPEEVYNHTAAFNAPWTWAVIHAFFILWSCVGNIVAWKFNERTLDKIREQAAELEEANRLRADFTAMVVHDLRSPLTAVVSTAAMLQDGLFGPVNEEQKRWLAKTQEQCRGLVDLVSDFLDLSKIEAGRIDLVKEKTDLYNLIRESLESYFPLAKAKDISLTSRVHPDVRRIEADPRRMDQVLSNLLSNAIKFTPQGGYVEVGAERQNGFVNIWVRDTGVGIPHDEIGQLFEKYRQGAGGKSSDGKGTGLGLVICKMIAEAHGGSISVQSKPGQGSTFTVQIPHNQ